MMMVECLVCGRKQELGNGIILGEAQIEIVGTTVFCACGSVVQEEDGVLCEYHLDVSDPDAKLVPVGEVQ